MKLTSEEIDDSQTPNPQTENGYTMIANEIMDVLCKTDLSGGQRRCLDYILRKTYGYHKKTDEISYSQFSDGTGISVRKVREHIKELHDRNIIGMHENVHTQDGKKRFLASTYWFNKKYNEWSQIAYARKRAKGGMHENVQGVCTISCTTKDNIYIESINLKKSNNIKESYADSEESATLETEPVYKTKSGKLLKGKRLESFNRFWESFNFKSGKASAADSWIKIPQLTNALVNQICAAATIEANRRVEIIKKGSTPKWAQGWITERRWEDEIYQQVETQQAKTEYFNIPSVVPGEEMK